MHSSPPPPYPMQNTGRSVWKPFEVVNLSVFVLKMNLPDSIISHFHFHFHFILLHQVTFQRISIYHFLVTNRVPVSKVQWTRFFPFLFAILFNLTPFCTSISHRFSLIIQKDLLGAIPPNPASDKVVIYLKHQFSPFPLHSHLRLIHLFCFTKITWFSVIIPPVCTKRQYFE